MASQPVKPEVEEIFHYQQPISFDFNSDSEALLNAKHVNQSNRADIMKKYLVYMELPKIRIGDYRKSSCVSGNIIRFHFLLRIARDEENTRLQLQPIKVYKAPVVNFAVIHRPFLDDDSAKGPIPKSPGTRSPLIDYSKEDDNAAASPTDPDNQMEEIAKDFRSDKRPTSQTLADDNRSEPDTQAQKQQPQEQEQRKQSGVDSERFQPSEAKRPSRASTESKQLEVETPARPSEREPVSPARLLSDDNSTAQTDATGGNQKQRRPKKYFVYCEIPKVLVGDYRNSSVVCSEIIHAHFLMKIAKDEENGQPQLQPIRRYHRPKVNFAVIHRSLIVDDEAIGPIPLNRSVKSPMIKEDDGDQEDEEQQGRPRDDIMHATMGFCYGRLPRSKYELVSQWSMVPSDNGVAYPELVLSKAEA